MPLPVDFLASYGPWAVVTGASSGIGAEFARQLAAAGLSVALVARRKEKLEALSATITETYPVQTKVIVADLTQEAGRKTVIADCTDLDVGLLVNNAGMELHGSFFRDPIEEHLKLIELNCSAVTVLSHAFGRRFADNGKGGIIFVSSVASVPNPWWSTYSASKSFVSSFALILREELMPKGVNVMVLEPGVTASEMSEGLIGDVDFSKLGMQTQSAHDCVAETLDSFVKKTPRVTPGLFNKISFTFMNILPTALTMKLVGIAMSSGMRPEVMKYT